MDYRYGSHTVYKIQYHFVFVTKYRYQVLKGDIGLKTRELIRQTCQAFEIEIIKGVVSKDHVHLLLSTPPTMAPSEIMRRIKGRSSAKLFESFPDLIVARLFGFGERDLLEFDASAIVDVSVKALFESWVGVAETTHVFLDRVRNPGDVGW